MTWTAPKSDRPVPTLGPERPALEAWLDYQRATLLHKCSGLTPEQLKVASVEPSTLTLLGLVRHMTEVERWWFQNFQGAGLPDVYCSEESPDGDFDDIDDADPETDFAAFEAECAASRTAAAQRGLEDTFPHKRMGTLDLRWIYIHMIEEYARHNGHADLIRERIDGVTGD